MFGTKSRGRTPLTQARVVLAQREVAYQIRRSRRRTVGLSIDSERGLVVHCPGRLSVSRLESILRDKSGWILKKIAETEQRKASRTSRSWQEGMLLPLQGNWYPLRLASHKGPPRICLEAGELRLYAEGNGTLLPPENDELKELVYAGYRPLAATLIEQRVFMLAGETGLQPARVRIREQKRRWGSCSAKKWLNLNWRLALAPPEVMDYVILHELCHLEHLNHSPRFWSRVGYFMPDYGRHRRWLRENGSELFL